MEKLSLDAVRPLLSALYDRLAPVRQAALRLLVRLPLDDSGWLETGLLLQKWLKAADQQPAGLSGQAVHGFPFWELVDSAVWIPAAPLRAFFHELLPELTSTDQLRLALLLAKAGDQKAINALLSQLATEDQAGWTEIAESLSSGNIARWAAKTEAAFKGHPDPDTRFWLAVALAKTGRTDALGQIFEQIQQNTLLAHFLDDLSGSTAHVFTSYLSQRTPMPPTSQAFLRSWAASTQATANQPTTIQQIASALAGSAPLELPGADAVIHLAIELGNELNPAVSASRRLAAANLIERTLADRLSGFHQPPFRRAIQAGEEIDSPKGELEGSFAGMTDFPSPDISFEQSFVSERVINTGFTAVAFPEHSLAKELTLQINQAYYFYFDVDWPDEGSIETTPTALPNLPPQTRLTVTLVGFQDGLRIDPDASIGELQTHQGGVVSVVRQPLSDQAPDTARSDRRLYFPVKTPATPGVYRMRCNLYWSQMLLQSRLVAAHVQVSPLRLADGEPALRSDLLDYKLASAGSAQLTGFMPHKLSLLLNSNDDGTHSMHFFGSDGKTLIKQDDVRFNPGELQGMIEQARGTLNLVSWGDTGDWKDQKFRYHLSTEEYKNKQIKIDRLTTDLSNLARWGRNFYLQVRTRLVASQKGKTTAQIKQARKDFEELMRLPGFLQIALKESPSYILPVAMIYDYPLDSGQSTDFTLCQTFRSAVEQQQPLAETACFKGECPNRDEPTSVCPSGFWGFRHYLGVPLSLEYAADAPAEIPYNSQPTVVMGEYKNFTKLIEHRQNLQQLPIDLKAEQDRARILNNLQTADPHIVYFYCHGGLVRGAPFLVVGSENNKGILDRPSLDANEILWGEPVRPLVILNGCHTSAVEPLAGLNLLEGFIVDAQAAGLIGTEITIYEELARDFAQELFVQLLKEAPVGQAVRTARLAILAQGNPLGLVYTPFVQAGLHLSKSA